MACGGGDGRIRVLDFSTGAGIAEWVVEERPDEGRWIWEVQYTHADQILVSDGPERTVAIWNAHDGAPIALMPGHSRRISSISINAEGTLIVSGSIDGTVRLWQFEGGIEKQVFRQEVDCRGLKIKGVKSDNEFIVPYLVERGAIQG
jgi:WD40 repeat protein